jgi:hypothetical protein
VTKSRVVAMWKKALRIGGIIVRCIVSVDEALMSRVR